MAKRSRSRRGWVPEPKKMISAGVYAARTLRGNSSVTYGKIGAHTTARRPRPLKAKRLKEAHSLTSSTGKSYSKYGNSRPIPSYLKEYQTMFNYNNERGLLKWTSGIQDYFVPAFCLDSVDLSDWYASTGGTNDFSLGVNNNNKIELYIKDVVGNFMMKNNANVQSKLIIYECKVKRSSASNPITQIKDGIAARFNETPATSTKYKLDNLAPTLSGIFTNHCKVENAKEIILDPGQVHEHKFRYAINRKFCVSDYYDEMKNGNIPFIGGWTRFILVKCMGTPVVTSDGLTVSTSSGKIVWTYDQKVDYLLVNTLKEKSYASGSIGVLATQQTIVEDTDTAAAVIDV